MAMQIRIGIFVALLVCSALAVDKGDEQEAARAVNEAINNQMQLDVINGDKGASEAFSDLAPYLGESAGTQDKSLDPWEAKTIAAIRGMSQDRLGVSTISSQELKFAQDAEEAKDVVEQTQQMAQIRAQDAKAEQADEISKQLAHARANLGEAADTNMKLAKEEPGPVDAPEALLESDEDTLGPQDGGVFADGETMEQQGEEQIGMLEVDETHEPDNFEPELYDGSDEDVEDQINESITNQVGDQLDALSSKKSPEAAGLEKFAKDAEEAQAQIEDMKAMTEAEPKQAASVGKIAAGAMQEAAKEASQEAQDDANLGEAQGEASSAKQDLSTSDAITNELAAAEAKLQKVQASIN
jgi:hypothetical protein